MDDLLHRQLPTTQKYANEKIQNEAEKLESKKSFTNMETRHRPCILFVIWQFDAFTIYAYPKTEYFNIITVTHRS